MRTLLLSFFLLISSTQLYAIDFFEGTYQEAIEKAEAENRLLLLYFTANWCSPCKIMERDVFPDPSVKQKVADNYIALKLDIASSENHLLLFRYSTDSKGVPQFYIINAKEEILKKSIGGKEIFEFKKFLDLPNNLIEPIGKIKSEQELIAEYAGKGKPLFYGPTNRNIKRKWKRGYELGMNVNRMKTKGDLYSQNAYSTNYSTFIENGTIKQSIRAGLSYRRKGGGRANDDAKIRLHYVELPVRGTVTVLKRGGLFKQPVQLSAEPYVGYAIGGKTFLDGEKSSVDFGSAANEWNRLDYGGRVGLNFIMGHFQSTVGYDFGLNNLSNQEEKEFYNRGAFISMSVIFGRSFPLAK